MKVNASFFIMDPFDCATVYDHVGEPFGLRVKDGAVMAPPLFDREALLVRRDGSVRVENVDIRQLAVEIAIDRGAEDIVIIGGLSGRLDHTLSTLAILEDLNARGIYGTVTDGQNRVRYMKSTSTLIARSPYKYLSLIAADEVVKGVDIEGCKYPLKKATLRRSHQFAVSNEITGNVAFIAIKKGGVYIIESRDA